jgi:hypothetical protein
MIELYITWDANSAAEQITGYKVMLDGAQAGVAVASEFTVPDVLPGIHTVAIVASNSLGDGPPSDQVQVNIPAIPTKVQNVKVQVSFTLS